MLIGALTKVEDFSCVTDYMHSSADKRSGGNNVVNFLSLMYGLKKVQTEVKV